MAASNAPSVPKSNKISPVLGRAIYSWRIQANLSREGLAKKAGLSKRTVWMAEKGYGIPSIIPLARIIEAVAPLQDIQPRKLDEILAGTSLGDTLRALAGVLDILPLIQALSRTPHTRLIQFELQDPTVDSIRGSTARRKSE